MIGIPIIIMAAASYGSSGTEALPPKENFVAVKKYKDFNEFNHYKRFFAVKTNVIPWLAGIMNVECEIQMGKKFSFSIPAWWSPYFTSRKYALRTFAIQPELRYWINIPGQSHFIGIHPGIAWYNLRYNDVRYQDTDCPLINIGVSYGYVLRLNRFFNAEFSIGAGYVKTRYDRFYNITNGAKIDTRQSSYWGIDRLELSFVYHFNL